MRLNYIYISQITDEEFLASQHFFLVALCQVVKICKLMERRVATCEWRGSRQQQRVERYQLPHIQLTLPANIKGGVRNGSFCAAAAQQLKTRNWREVNDLALQLINASLILFPLYTSKQFRTWMVWFSRHKVVCSGCWSFQKVPWKSKKKKKWKINCTPKFTQLASLLAYFF